MFSFILLFAMYFSAFSLRGVCFGNVCILDGGVHIAIAYWLLEFCVQIWNVNVDGRDYEKNIDAKKS